MRDHPQTRSRPVIEYADRVFDLACIADRPEIASIPMLHKALKPVYGPNDEPGAS
jgi:hypothetical protein